jgi:hypothetical protein
MTDELAALGLAAVTECATVPRAVPPDQPHRELGYKDGPRAGIG